MTTHHFEPIGKYGQDHIDEIEKQITKAIPFLQKNLSRNIEYLKKEESLKSYIEINLPFFDSNLSFQINLYDGKVLILIKSWDDKSFFGYLILEGFDCMDENVLKRIGRWDREKIRYKNIH